MSRKSRRARLPADPVEAEIESLTHEGRGVAHVAGKAVFVAGALPGERVRFLYTDRRRSHDMGQAVEVLTASPERVEPHCPHFQVCGGCALQHLEAGAQLRAKQQVLLDNLERLGKVAAAEILPPLSGPQWGYRRKARLGVRYVHKKGRVLVGFRERGSAFLAEIERCPVLHPAVGERIVALQELIAGLSVYDRIAQIEVAIGDERRALVFRNLEPLSDGDRARLRAFGLDHGFDIYEQPGGPDSVAPVSEGVDALGYRLPEFEVEYRFGPLDFTQVNAEINRRMVPLAVGLLDPAAEDRVLDLFCGLGNFTLPLARRAARVVGVEGDRELVRLARANAERNGIANAEFHTADLSADFEQEPWLREGVEKVLLDPPRSGALEVLPHVVRLGPGRIVYVSCNPATLARDAGELVHTHGYRLLKAGVMDMFPNTGHVESIALFEKG